MGCVVFYSKKLCWRTWPVVPWHPKKLRDLYLHSLIQLPPWPVILNCQLLLPSCHRRVNRSVFLMENILSVLFHPRLNVNLSRDLGHCNTTQRRRKESTTIKIKQLTTMLDPRFPRGGGTNSKVGAPTYYLAKKFPKTTWKWKNLDPEEGSASLAPPSIRQCNVRNWNFLFWSFKIM